MLSSSPQFESASPRLIPGWFFSCAVHFFLFLGAAWLSDLQGSRPVAQYGPEERAVEIVLRPREPQANQYFTEAASPVAGESLIAFPAPALPETPAPSALPEIAPSTAIPVATSRTAILPIAASTSVRVGSKPGTIAQKSSSSVETTVFGVPGEGSTFVFVFDRSASMAGRPLDAAKAELRRSLESLGRENKFQIIFYNNQPAAISSAAGKNLLAADSAGLAAADAFIEEIRADNGTEHLAALRLALRWRPDVVFLLTDGNEPELLPGDLEAIQRLNQGSAIHAIEFGLGPKPGKEGFLERLAAQNGGRYGYVDVIRLP